MATTLQIDTLALAKRIRDANGDPDEVARAMAEGVGSVDISHLATKADLAEARNELKHEIGQVRHELKHEIGEVRQELRREIGDTRAELKNDIVDVRGEIANVRGEIASVRIEMSSLVNTVTFRMGVFMIATVALTSSLTVALLRILPPSP